MTPPDDEDRGAILARRAAFITSTLSMIHCGPPSERAPVPTTTSAPVTATATGTAPARTASDPTPDDPRTFDQAIAKAPPRGAPTGLPGDIGKHAETLETDVAAIYADARALWDVKEAPCDPGEPTCKAAWKKIGASLAALREKTRVLGTGLSCTKWSAMITTLQRRRMDHVAFVGALADEIDARLARIARRGGSALATEWEALSAESKVVPPMPCLRCAPPARRALDGVVLFEDGASTLSGGAEAALGALLEAVKQGGTAVPVELVGHADPKETGDLASLSKKRAEAVGAWLKSKGIAAGRLRAVALGGALPQANDAAENRRVELSLVSDR